MVRCGLADLYMEQLTLIPLFSGLSRDVLEVMTAEARVVNYDMVTMLFSRGDPADSMFVVLSGQVRLFILTAGGRETVIDYIESGQSFAEAAVFGSGGLPVNAEAGAGSCVLHIPAAPILFQVASDMQVALRMMEALARWQRQMLERVLDLKSRSGGQRLAAALLEQAGVNEGKAIFKLRVSKAELASLIGIAPESLSRRLMQLRDLGVTTRGSTIEIADIAALRHYCNAEAVGDH